MSGDCGTDNGSCHSGACGCGRRKQTVEGQMTSLQQVHLVRKISTRLFISLIVLIPCLVLLAIQPWHPSGSNPEPDAVYIVLGLGALGAFVSLQRRLKSLGEDDLWLLSESWVYALLIPLVGGILASVLYCLFLSGLVTGELFPGFCGPSQGSNAAGADKTNAGAGFSTLFSCHANGPRDYAKLMFWSFLAGFSEKFVVDIIGRFDSPAGPGASTRDEAGVPQP